MTPIPTVELARDSQGCWIWQATLPKDTTFEAGDWITVRLVDDRILPRSGNRIRAAIVSGTPFRSRHGGRRVTVIPATFGG